MALRCNKPHWCRDTDYNRKNSPWKGTARPPSQRTSFCPVEKQRVRSPENTSHC